MNYVDRSKMDGKGVGNINKQLCCGKQELSKGRSIIPAQPLSDTVFGGRAATNHMMMRTRHYELNISDTAQC